MEELLNLINSYVEGLENTIPVKTFTQNNKCISGQFLINTTKGKLTFDAQVPFSFPLGGTQACIKFKCDDIEGYAHVNLDNSICLHSTPSTVAKERLKKEFDLLFEWIEKYYIEEQKDEKYQYLLLPQNGVNMVPQYLLYADTDKHYSKNDCGFFEYSLVGENVAITQEIGNTKIEWSKNIKALRTVTSFWIFIADEPVIERRKVIQNWVDFKKYLSETNLERLNSFREKIIKGKDENKPHSIPLMIGYFIGDNSKKEVHWEMIELPILDNFPIKNLNNIKTRVGLQNVAISWQRSANITYERFFGRGKLSDTITEKKILIIGVGALGSGLALMLAKGGAKYLTLCDFDIVESGNL